MKTFDEFFNTDIFSSEDVEICKERIEAAQKEVNDRLKAGDELDFWEKPYMPARGFIDYLYGADKPEASMECEVKLEKAPDPAKEEIFATCLNFLHTHTEDELYEIVRLAFKAAEVFGY